MPIKETTFKVVFVIAKKRKAPVKDKGIEAIITSGFKRDSN